MRPEFLRRITRVPSWRFALRNLAGRGLRIVRGIEREPVAPPTERDFARTYVLLGFTAGSCATGIGFAFVISFSGVFLCH